MTQSLQWLERAAALNHSGAINALGWHSLEIKHNYTEAAQRFERAHQLGNKDAAHNLGHMWYYARNADRVIDRVRTVYGVIFGPTVKLNSTPYGTGVRLSVRNGCLVAKRWKIGPKLLLITNRKSHKPFHMARKSTTLDDLEGS